MVDLLLITDIPRLRKVYLRLADDQNLRLRVASSLEQGGEEIATDKPAMVFVQTHVSGLSAEILLIHLKKQLGRRRTRFVLLAPPDQVSDTVLKLYHNYIDTSQDDHLLLEAFKQAVDTLATRGKKRAAATAETAETAATVPQAPEEPLSREPVTVVDRVDFQISPSAFSPQFSEAVSTAVPEPPEPSLEEQGSVYAANHRLSVYSEFSSSLESAVSDIRPTELPREPLVEQPPLRANRQSEAAGGETHPSRPKRATFLLWLVPLLLVVVVVTILQHRDSSQKPVDVAPPEPAGKPATAPAPPAEATKAPTSAARQPAAEGDRAMLSAIARNRNTGGPAAPAPVAARPTALPPFIPRDGQDKGYGASNPGWERYMGLVTEFKVFREGASIKAIQAIDRGGQGIPENFMRSALAQLAGASSFVPASSEKKDGYEIQRGQVAANLKAVFYRDAKGGKLRAFVVTWQ